MSPGPSRDPARRLETLRFLKFCIVGALGFVADTGTLLGLVRLAHLDPLPAKALSFGVAVLVTFEFNRRWAFETARRGPWLVTFGAYLGVQTTGFLVNGAVFTGALLLLPAFEGRLVACAALAALAALAVNFLGARRLVFRGGRPDGTGGTVDSF